ncbi:MAG: sigma-70 family RNA polymerase sigma factor [Thermoanaerobacteraceae bacterium]|nr:sigma-70 family RNA polymerase sigma factor [Thermoanaerobacteraceae bacterium]
MGQIDEEIFKDIYDAYYKKVYRAVYMLAGPDAEDIAQEAFVKLYNTPPKDMSNPGAWVTKVAVNLAKNHIRSDAARTRREERTLIDNAVSIDEVALRVIERLEVRKALSKLNKRDRDVLYIPTG